MVLVIKTFQKFLFFSRIKLYELKIIISLYFFVYGELYNSGRNIDFMKSVEKEKIQ